MPTKIAGADQPHLRVQVGQDRCQATGRERCAPDRNVSRQDVLQARPLRQQQLTPGQLEQPHDLFALRGW